MPERDYFKVSRDAFEKNSGYKNTAYALAELIDNAAEENARNITVIIQEKRKPTRHISTIGILDDGDGMDSNTIQLAICEKSGTRHDRMHGSGKQGRRKFGKYGVGLPKASIYAADKFTVWSWKDSSPKKAFRNHIDIKDDEWIENGAKVPESVAEAAPAEWLALTSHAKSKSGTFILWEELTNLTWKWSRRGESKGFIPNLQQLVGRIYRHIISQSAGEKNDPPLNISIVVCDGNLKSKEKANIPINDPLYLTPNTGCLEPTDIPDWEEGAPMFDLIIDQVMPCTVQLEDGSTKKCEIKIRGSVSKLTTRTVIDGRYPGTKPWGKKVKDNEGVSFLREGRELTLDTRWCVSDPRERWWGLELDFPHELDWMFGVTNNKQSLEGLLQSFNITHADIKEGDETSKQTIDRINKDDWSQAFCIFLCWEIDKWVKKLRNLAFTQTPNKIRLTQEEDEEGNAIVIEEEEKNPTEEAEEIATNVESGQPDAKTAEETAEAIKEYLAQKNVPAEKINQITKRIVTRGLKYIIWESPGLGSPLFTVDEIVDAKLITLNTDHPGYSYLIDTLSFNSEDGLANLPDRMNSAQRTLMLLLEAWARSEVQALPEEKKHYIRAREDWGRHLADFLEEVPNYTE